MKNVKIFFIIFLLIFGIIISASGCSFAGGVPKYNPKDPNPKPGLYYVGETKHFPIQGTVLKDGRVLILATTKYFERVDGVEIFDPTTNKLEQYLPLPYPLFLGHTAGGIFPTLVLDDGRVLFNSGLGLIESGNRKTANYYQILNPVTNEISVIGRGNMCRYYYDKSNPKDYFSFSPSMMNDLGKGKVTSYCGSRMEEMEIIDLNNNTISKPIKKGDKDYITPPEKYPKGPGIYIDLITSYRKLYPELNLDEKLNLPNNSFVNLFNYKLTNTRYLVYATNEVDYGVTIAVYGKVRASWFRPLYEYNTDTKELIKKNEYLRGAGRMYHLNDTNKLIIIGGAIRDVFPPINPNADPKDISLTNRLLYPGWAKKASKKIYIYVY